MRYLFTTYFYDDGSNGYSYKEVSSTYKPKDIREGIGCDIYEEIARSQREINDLIYDLKEA